MKRKKVLYIDGIIGIIRKHFKYSPEKRVAMELMISNIFLEDFYNVREEIKKQVGDVIYNKVLNSLRDLEIKSKKL